MSTLVLELPDKQIQVLERIAQQRSTNINAVVVELVNDIALEADNADGVIQDRKEHEAEALAEFETLIDQLADELAAPNAPILSDYAVSRASIYEDHP